MGAALPGIPSVGFRRDHFTAGPRGQGTPDGRIDGVLGVGDVGVTVEGVDALRMQAAGGFPAGIVVGDAVERKGVGRGVVVVQGVEVITVPPAGSLVEKPARRGAEQARSSSGPAAMRANARAVGEGIGVGVV